MSRTGQMKGASALNVDPTLARDGDSGSGSSNSNETAADKQQEDQNIPSAPISAPILKLPLETLTQALLLSISALHSSTTPLTFQEHQRQRALGSHRATLAGVCRLWKNIVYDSPAFWNRITVTPTNHSSAQLVRSLVRAKAYPLDVAFHCLSAAWSQNRRTLVQNMFALVSGRSLRRIDILDYHLAYEGEFLLPFTSFSLATASLQHFGIRPLSRSILHGPWVHPHGLQAQTITDFLAEVSSTLISLDIPPHLLPDPASHPVYTRLTNLTLVDSMNVIPLPTLPHLLGVIQQCGRLQSLELGVRGMVFQGTAYDDTRELHHSVEPFVHPALEVIHLVGSGEQWFPWSDIFAIVHVPRLVDLTLTRVAVKVFDHLISQIPLPALESLTIIDDPDGSVEVFPMLLTNFGTTLTTCRFEAIVQFSHLELGRLLDDSICPKMRSVTMEECWWLKGTEDVRSVVATAVANGSKVREVVFHGEDVMPVVE